MRSRDISTWMWSEALSMLDRAERLQRQFFHHSAASEAVSWIPPVDITDTANELRVQVALPGVPADSITVALEPRGLTVSAMRAFPCDDETQNVHRIEIPYGRFERQIGLPPGDPRGSQFAPLVLASKSMVDGVLTLVFRKKETA